MNVISFMEKQNEIEILRKEISEAREAYYNLSPIMSDIEFDAKLKRLEELDPSHVEIKKIGATAPQISIWEKVKHEIPMGSLNKANSTEEIEEWSEKIKSDNYFATHKIDGSSMELVYENGELKRCVTRGDGIIGEDVTFNVIQIESIPKRLEKEINLIVRGEVVMMKKMFNDKYSEVYANPRNTAAAKVREKKNKGEDCKNLEFIAFWTDKDEYGTVHEMMKELAKLRFKTPSDSIHGSIREIKSYFEITKKNREELEYEIDGIVVSVDNIEYLKELGDHNLRPEGQIAWKFDPAASTTRVRDIIWQVGPSGRICPVAQVEPVNIGGVVITNISLHNMKIFDYLKLSRYSEVLVTRRNDVIPYIEANITEKVYISDME